MHLRNNIVRMRFGTLAVQLKAVLNLVLYNKEVTEHRVSHIIYISINDCCISFLDKMQLLINIRFFFSCSRSIARPITNNNLTTL